MLWSRLAGIFIQELQGMALSWSLLFLQHPFIMTHLTSTRRQHIYEKYVINATLHLFSSYFVTLWSFTELFLCYSIKLKEEGKLHFTTARLWKSTLGLQSLFCSPGWRRSSIIPTCFCKSCQFVFAAPCQYRPRERSPGYMMNPWGGFTVWTYVKFQDGFSKRWANKCLDCYSSANFDWGVKLPTRWGQGVYMTWTWSAVSGLKPNGHTICYLLSKTMNLLRLGQPQLLDCIHTGSVGRSFPHRVQLAHQGIVIRWRTCPVISFNEVPFDFPSVGGLCQRPAWDLVELYEPYIFFLQISSHMTTVLKTQSNALIY